MVVLLEKGTSISVLRATVVDAVQWLVPKHP